ncbi:MAG: hypothetical protein AAGJ35_01035, partial [Myxococcota bacterium]
MFRVLFSSLYSGPSVVLCSFLMLSMSEQATTQTTTSRKASSMQCFSKRPEPYRFPLFPTPAPQNRNASTQHAKASTQHADAPGQLRPQTKTRASTRRTYAPNKLRPKTQASTFIRGVSLGMYFQDQDDDYEQFLIDIAKTGASHVGFVISWYQKNVSAHNIKPHPTKTMSDARLRTTIQQAQRRGLEVFLLPIVRLQERGPNDWRGVLAPKHPERWWQSYRRYLFHYAELAQQHNVALISVGSELVSMEPQRQRWLDLITGIRQIYSGKLIYSANWDHYEPVTFWDALDYIGISNYYELSKKINPPLKQLKQAWTKIRKDIERWKQRYPNQPLLFTEVGYYSQQGTN